MRLHISLSDKSSVISPSKKFYAREIAELVHIYTEKELRSTYKYKTSRNTNIIADDVITIKGNGKTVKATVVGFPVASGNDSREMMCLADDGYILVDLFTQGRNILKATRNGKPVPPVRHWLKEFSSISYVLVPTELSSKDTSFRDDPYYQQAVKELSVKNLRKQAKKEIKRLGNISIRH